MPEVSIVMPVFNRERVIRDAIDSCLNQTFEDWELLIVDDCSSDRSLEIADSYQDRRIRTVRLDVNKGPGHARNVALDMVQGNWVTVLDSDDAYCPRRLEFLVELARSGPDNCVYFDRLKTFEHLDRIPVGKVCNTLDAVAAGPSQISSSKWLQQFGYSNPFYPRNVLDAGLRYPTEISLGEDTVFFLQVMKACGGSAMFVDLPLYVYRRTPGSLVQTGSHRMGDRVVSLAMIRELFADDPAMNLAIEARAEILEDDQFTLDLRRGLGTKKLGIITRHLLSNPSRAVRLPWRLVKSIRLRTLRATRIAKQKLWLDE